MNLKQELQKKLKEVQDQITVANRIPDDTFPLGTVVVFNSSAGHKWYYLKTDEESWRDMIGNTTKDLATWIYESTQANIGYFEVYILTVAATPIFASS